MSHGTFSRSLLALPVILLFHSSSAEAFGRRSDICTSANNYCNGPTANEYASPPSIYDNYHYAAPTPNYWSIPQYEPPQPTPEQKKAAEAAATGQDLINQSAEETAKGNLALAIKLLEKAIRQFKTAVQTDPSDKTHHDKLRLAKGYKVNAQALLYYQQGKLELAAEEYRKAEILWKQLWDKVGREGHEQARENLRIVERMLKSQGDRKAAEASLKKRNFSKAVKEYKRALETASESEKPKLRQQLQQAELGLKTEKEIKTADRFLDKGKPEEAVIYYGRALRINPDDKEANEGLQKAERMITSRASTPSHTNSQADAEDIKESKVTRETRESKEIKEIRTGIDQLEDLLAKSPDDPKLQKALQDAKRELAEKMAGPDDRVKAGANTKAGDQLMSAANKDAKTGQPFEPGGRHKGSLGTLGNNVGKAPKETTLEDRIASTLSNDDLKKLKADPEYLPLAQENEKAVQKLKIIDRKMEENKKQLAYASGDEAERLRGEQEKLKKQETAAKGVKEQTEKKIQKKLKDFSVKPLDGE